MNHTTREQLIVLVIFAAAVLSTYSRITSPVTQLKDPYEDTNYYGLGNSSAPEWYYNSFTSDNKGKLEWERHRADLMKEKIQKSIRVIDDHANVSTGVYELDALRRQAVRKQEQKQDKKEILANFIQYTLKNENMTPMQTIVLGQILSGLNKNSKKEEEVNTQEKEKSANKPSLLEKMEEKLNIDTKEAIKNVDKRERRFNFGIFKLTPREDHSKLNIKLNPRAPLLEKKMLLASSSYYDYEYNSNSGSKDDNSYYDYGGDAEYIGDEDDYYDYSYEDLNAISTEHDNTSNSDVNTNTRTNASTSTVIEKDYEKQLKKYQSELSPAEKQELRNKRNQYKKYESYQGAKGIDDYQKQMSDFFGDSDGINNLVNDVKSGYSDDEVSDDGQYKKVQDLFSGSGLTDEQVEDFKNNSDLFNSNEKVYDNIYKDVRKEMGVPEEK